MLVNALFELAFVVSQKTLICGALIISLSLLARAAVLSRNESREIR